MSRPDKIPDKVELLLKNGEKIEIALQTWHDHIKARHEITAFSTIVKDQLYHITPTKEQTFLPYTEYHGDHDMNWILCINIKTKEEIFRKNVRFIDMIDWKLFSS